MHPVLWFMLGMAGLAIWFIGLNSGIDAVEQKAMDRLTSGTVEMAIGLSMVFIALFAICQ